MIVFRCLTLIFPIKLRTTTHRPFIIILGIQAAVILALAILPFFDLSFITHAYVYASNYGECVYGFNSTSTPELVYVVSVLWWGPFFISIVSTTIFVIALSNHSKNSAAVGRKTYDVAKRKIVILTAFFITCYIPKACYLLLVYLLNQGTISWGSVVALPHGIQIMTHGYSLMCFVLPTARAAFTPQMLSLLRYMEQLCKRRGGDGKYVLKSELSRASLKTTYFSLKPDKSNGNS